MMDASSVTCRRIGIATVGRLRCASRVASNSVSGWCATGKPTLVDSIRYLSFGTTNLCNASGIHCPTGKAETDHLTQEEMSLGLLSKVLAGLRGLNIVITEQIGFGLFGDGLVDKQVVERAKIVRQCFPEVPLVINPNGAAFDKKKHRVLRDLNVTIGLHVESLIPGTYDHLMAPLRPRDSGRRRMF